MFVSSMLKKCINLLSPDFSKNSPNIKNETYTETKPSTADIHNVENDDLENGNVNNQLNNTCILSELTKSDGEEVSVSSTDGNKNIQGSYPINQLIVEQCDVKGMSIDDFINLANEASFTPSFDHPLLASSQCDIEDDGTLIPSYGPLSTSSQCDLEDEGTLIPSYGPHSTSSQCDIEDEGTLIPSYGPLSTSSQCDIEDQATLTPSYDHRLSTSSHCDLEDDSLGFINELNKTVTLTPLGDNQTVEMLGSTKSPTSAQSNSRDDFIGLVDEVNETETVKLLVTNENVLVVDLIIHPPPQCDAAEELVDMVNDRMKVLRLDDNENVHVTDAINRTMSPSCDTTDDFVGLTNELNETVKLNSLFDNDEVVKSIAQPASPQCDTIDNFVELTNELNETAKIKSLDDNENLEVVDSITCPTSPQCDMTDDFVGLGNEVNQTVKAKPLDDHQNAQVANSNDLVSVQGDVKEPETPSLVDLTNEDEAYSFSGHESNILQLINNVDSYNLNIRPVPDVTRGENFNTSNKPRISILNAFDPLLEHDSSQDTVDINSITENSDNTLVREIQTNSEDHIEKMADMNDKINQLEVENAELKLQLNAAQQTRASLELQLSQKEEIVIKTQTESLRKDQATKQEIKLLKEKLEEKQTENDNTPVKELQESIKLLKSREMKHLSEISNFKKILEDYDKVFSTQLSEYRKVTEEHETVKGHLANLELAFSDVHQKYERCKKIIEGFKSNEGILRDALAASEESVSKNEQKYESLKAHAKAQLEKANQEIILMRDQYDTEVHKLSSIIKRLEIKIASLMDSLDQKNKECSALAALCDEVTGKV